MICQNQWQLFISLLLDIEMELFTSQQIADKLGISLMDFYSLRRRNGIKAFKKENEKYYFLETQFVAEIPKYYPLKTTETFYIYESKINKQ